MLNRQDSAALNQTMDIKSGITFLRGLNLGKNLWGCLNSPKNREIVNYMTKEYRDSSTVRDEVTGMIWGN